MRFRTFTLLTTLAFAAACGGDAPSIDNEVDGGTPVQGGTAIVALLSDFDALSQFTSTTFDTGVVLRTMLYTPLVRMDAEMEYEPYLVESYELAEDGSSLTFALREDAFWHDGEPVTADDIVWSVETFMNPDLAYANIQYFGFVDRVEKVDDRHVTFHFNAVHSDPLADFLEWEPMPKHLLGDVSVSDMRTAPFNRNPVGNGPFRFVSWTPNQEAVFEANEEFFLGRPNLDRVVFRVIPEQTTQLTEILTGQTDFVRGIPPAESATVENSDRARLISYSGRSYVYLSWNGARPMFDDVRVRRALTMAIDRQEIVDALLYGYGTIATSDVMPFQWQFADLEPIPHDVDAARELLAEAGWTDSDGDGILDKDGQPFRFTLETNAGNDLRQDIIVIVQNSLAEVGIQAEPRQAEFNSLIARLRQKDYEAVVGGWNVDIKFDPSETMTCDAAVYNYPGYCNPELDALVMEALTTIDREEALPLWIRYQEIMQRDQPQTFLYYLDERVGVSNRLRGVVADARGHMVSVADWWIPEALQ